MFKNLLSKFFVALFYGCRNAKGWQYDICMCVVLEQGDMQNNGMPESLMSVVMHFFNFVDYFLEPPQKAE